MLVGCTQQQSSQDLKEQTAQATADVKRDAKAVAAAISERWSRDKQLGSFPLYSLISQPCIHGKL
jgi:hypothetical protein